MALHKSKCNLIACVLLSSLFFLLSNAHAHGGHGESKAAQIEPTPAPETERNIYTRENDSSPDLLSSQFDLLPHDFWNIELQAAQ